MPPEDASAKNRLLGASGSIEVAVRLPAGSRVETKAAGAEFRAVGRFGHIAFEGAHGSIELDEAASVRLTTDAGDVEVGRLNGPAEISTGKGDIRIAEATTGTVVLDGVDLVDAARQTAGTYSGGMHTFSET